MFQKINKIICVAAILVFASSAMAQYRVAPVKLSLTKNDKITSLEFANSGNVEKSFQVAVLKKDGNGSKSYKPSTDLIASPTIFKISPQGTQLIRVALKNNNAKSINEDDYRISIKEVPQGRAKNGGVRFITEMSLPVTVAN